MVGTDGGGRLCGDLPADRRLRRNIAPAISILGSPADFALPVEDSFDTEYHTNARGRGLRTDKLEKLLAPYRS